MGIILKQLTETFTAGLDRAIKKKFDTDQLTLDLNDNICKSNSATAQTYYNKLNSKQSEYELYCDNDFSIQDYLDQIVKTEPKLVEKISEFVKENALEKEDPLSILWAKVIDSSVNKEKEIANKTIDLFNSIVIQSVENSDNFELFLNDLQNETLDIIKNKEDLLAYYYEGFLHSNYTTSVDLFNFDTTDKVPEAIRYAVNNKTYKDNQEFLTDAKNAENLPNLIEYIKENYTDKKYQDEIREYLALSTLVKIYSDARFKDDANFDANNQIGLNLTYRLLKVEHIIRNDKTLVNNTNSITSLKTKSNAFSNEILGKKKEHKYQPIIKVLQQYKRRLDFMEDNADMVKDYYLRRFGIENKTTEEVEDFLGAKEKRVEKIIKKIKINAVTKIDPALQNWEENLKTEYPDPLKLPGKNIKELTDIIGSPLLAQAVYFARKQKSQLLGEDKNSNTNIDSSQLDLFDQLDLQ